VVCCLGADGCRELHAPSYVSSRESVSSSPPRLDFSLNYMPHAALAEMSAHSAASSADASNQTSSTAVRETDIQFLNDTVAVGSKPSVSRAPRLRTHHVNVTVPTDPRNDMASTRAQRKSRVTFQDVRNSNVGPSARSGVGTLSAAGTERQQNDNVLSTADRGERVMSLCSEYFLLFFIVF